MSWASGLAKAFLTWMAPHNWIFRQIRRRDRTPTLGMSRSGVGGPTLQFRVENVDLMWDLHAIYMGKIWIDVGFHDCWMELHWILSFRLRLEDDTMNLECVFFTNGGDGIHTGMDRFPLLPCAVGGSTWNHVSIIIWFGVSICTLWQTNIAIENGHL